VTAALTLGAYRLIAELGHGGMADVFLAAAEGPAGSGFTKLAVVKKLRSHLAEDPEFVAMLMDEARITARLSHPNVVQLFEMGRAGEAYFLAMEFLEGQPLHRVEQRVERLGADVPREAYCAIVSDVLAGLHHAHELTDYDGKPLEVAHRDVTPHNVFVTYEGAVKVLDFGIAKATGRACVTQAGTVKGKVRYMSPEQACGADVDRRTDIFACGVILWNVATGSRLWLDRSDAEVAQALRDGDYEPSPRSLFPAVPEELDAICRKALAFRREDRYATADDMRAALEAFLGRGAIDARKKLASAMKDLFVSERAKLRGVLETSALKNAMSFELLAAAIGSTLPREAREPAPVVQPRTSTMAMNRSLPPQRSPKHHARARITRMLAIAAGVAVLLTVVVRGVLTHGSSHPRAVARAVVVSELTTGSREVRSKDESGDALVLKKPSIARRVPGSGSRVVGGEAASSSVEGLAKAEAGTATDGARPTRKRSPLDSADPWVDDAH
jgi:serine/threonine protein kinase